MSHQTDLHSLPAIKDQLHQALSYSNSTAVRSKFTGALITYSITLPLFIVLAIWFVILLVAQRKKMVPNKRLLYGMIICMSLLQIISATGGIMYSVCILISENACMDTFAMIQYFSAWL